MRPVVFNSVALEDLDEITGFIAQRNPSAADLVREDLLNTAERLGSHPELGIRPRFSTAKFAGIRFVLADKYPIYLLFYRESAAEIEVLRILHGNRNLPGLFE